ncbi:hypothetical protein [Paraburkholderia sp. A1RO-1]|uniref:hypothetical protein n=1 Tax=Paraburkholderia sp. A1RO-1 TaxID=3028368 RepID=UPI003B81D453
MYAIKMESGGTAWLQEKKSRMFGSFYANETSSTYCWRSHAFMGLGLPLMPLVNLCVA